MAIVKRTIGSAVELRKKFRRAGITEFDTIQEIQDFQSSYDKRRTKILIDTKVALQEEAQSIPGRVYETKNSALESVDRLKESISLIEVNIRDEQKNLNQIRVQSFFLGLFASLMFQFRKGFDRRRIWRLEHEIHDVLKRSNNKVRGLETRLKRINDSIDDLAAEECQSELKKLDRTARVIDDSHSLIQGTLGEHRTESALKKLPDSYIIINDVDIRFTSPIINKTTNDKIMSVQIDHMVVGPTGIYVIETKHWGEKYLQKKTNFSPIDQLKRSGYAIFVLLNGAINNSVLKVSDNWGASTLKIRNVLVLTAKSISNQYQFVHVTTPNQLNQYIVRGERVLSEDACTKVSDFILRRIEP